MNRLSTSKTIESMKASNIYQPQLLQMKLKEQQTDRNNNALAIHLVELQELELVWILLLLLEICLREPLRV